MGIHTPRQGGSNWKYQERRRVPKPKILGKWNVQRDNFFREKGERGGGRGEEGGGEGLTNFVSFLEQDNATFIVTWQGVLQTSQQDLAITLPHHHPCG